MMISELEMTSLKNHAGHIFRFIHKVSAKLDRFIVALLSLLATSHEPFHSSFLFSSYISFH